MKVPGGEIIGVEWRSGYGSVCFVAVDYKRYWQAYVGPEVKFASGILGLSLSMGPQDTEYKVATHGCKLDWREARAFFPQFDITKYKTYPKTETE